MDSKRQPTARPTDPTSAAAETSRCSSSDCDCTPGMGRREFIQWVGASAAALSAGSRGLAAFAGPFDAADTVDHCVPADKKLKPEWIEALTAKGEPTVYSGPDLATIGMPVGGIGAGQLYLTGDGRLAHWDLFNTKTPGYGYRDSREEPQQTVDQGFAIRIESPAGTVVRPLSAEGFPGVRFRGEYPTARVWYEDEKLPVAVTLDAFSPFIPLNAADSALPATVMQFTVKNTSAAPVDVTLAGWLENAVARHSAAERSGQRTNRLIKGPPMVMVLGEAKETKPTTPERPAIRMADFEGDDYGEWKVEGEAFGEGPATGTLARQQRVEGFQGKGLVNTFLGGDKPHGTLTSPPFKIERKFIAFLIGGGNHRDKTCINLLVDGAVVRTATGNNRELLKWHHWNVDDLAGKEARIEIVDQESGAWGHINIDQIEMCDRPKSARTGPLREQPDFGTMGLALLADEPQALLSASLPDGPLPDTLFDGDALAATDKDTKPFGQPLRGAVGQKIALEPGEEKQLTFAVTWFFPNRPPGGHYYATRFRNAAEVARYLTENLDRLAGQTRLWHDTYYDSTLPHWLLDRLHSTVSTLATSTCEWWANGRFWAYEGVRCCHGTCGHVWNYEHAMARLFPQLERSVREMQDFNPEEGFDAETGVIRFRGNWPDFWCGDAQTGYVLKALREHQTAPDPGFLQRNWPNIRKALEYLFVEDADDDGLIESSQHNTYDINFFGPNTMIGSLYLGALRAGETMADEMGEKELAARCRKIFDSGKRLTVEKLYNGEYFIQIVDLEKHPKHQYGQGCLSDQLFGQGWAHQVGLGYVYPKETILATLQAIWKYNWAPDIAPQNETHPPQRWFAYPGEAGLFTCTWPKSKHLGPESVLYRDEIWTGIEYQVAGHMAFEGMVTEALAICRAVHERYHPAKHNPWNEIECGDHYARGLASWGVLTGLSGFEYHGPNRHIGFGPRIAPHDFRAVFTAAEGWGTMTQRRTSVAQTADFNVKWGKLPVKTIALDLPDGTNLQATSITAADRSIPAQTTQDGARVQITLTQPVVLEEGQTLHVEMKH